MYPVAFPSTNLVATHVHTNALPTNTTCNGELSIMEAVGQAADHHFYGVTFADHSSDPRAVERKPSPRQFANWVAWRRDQIEFAKAEFGMPVIDGVEVNLAPDGALELDNEIAGVFGYVLASQHGGLGATEKDAEAILDRLTVATANPVIHAVAHPSRNNEEVGVDWLRVFEHFALTGTLVEVNLNHFLKTKGDHRTWRPFFDACSNTGAPIVLGLDVHNRGMWPQEVCEEDWWTHISWVQTLYTMMASCGIVAEQIINQSAVSWQDWLQTPKPERASLYDW